MGVEYLSIVGTLNPCAGNFHFRLSFGNGKAANTAVSICLEPRFAASSPVPQALRLPSLLHASVTVEYGIYASPYRVGTEPFFVFVTRSSTVEQFLRVIFNKHGMDKYV